MSRVVRSRNGGKRGNIDTVIVDLEKEIDNISIFELDRMAQGEKQNLINDLQTLVKLYELRGPVGREGATETMYKASMILQKLQTDKKMKSNWDMRRMQMSMTNMGAPTIVQQVVAPSQPSAAPANQGDKKGEDGKGKTDEDQLEATFKSMIIDLGSDGVDLDINENINVMGNEGVWEKLKTKMEVAVKMPNAVPDLNKLNAVLVYGPPGTGKTMYARQLAALRIGGLENAKFMSIAASAIESKYHGESARNVRAMWKVARDSVEFEKKDGKQDYRGKLVRPVVIFFDEFDALFSGGEHSKPVQNEFLTQMEGLLSKNRGIFFMAATNSFKDIPANVMNRFSETIWLGLPGLSENTDAKSASDLFYWNFWHTRWELSRIIDSTILRYEAPTTFFRSWNIEGGLPAWADNREADSSLEIGLRLAEYITDKDANFITQVVNDDPEDQDLLYKVVGQHTTINARSVNNMIVNILWVRNLESAFTRIKNLSTEPSGPWILDERERYEVKDGVVVPYKKSRLIYVPVESIKSDNPAEELKARLTDTYKESQKYRKLNFMPGMSETEQLEALDRWVVAQEPNINIVYPTKGSVEGQTIINGQVYAEDDIATMLMPEPINMTQLEEILVTSGKTYPMSELQTFSKKFAEFNEKK